MDTLTLPICARGTAVCTADGVRVRHATLALGEQPAAGAVAGYLSKGQVVTVYAVDTGWAIVDTGVRQSVNAWLVGWVSTQYLQMGTLVP